MKPNAGICLRWCLRRGDFPEALHRHVWRVLRRLQRGAEGAGLRTACRARLPAYLTDCLATLVDYSHAGREHKLYQVPGINNIFSKYSLSCGTDNSGTPIPTCLLVVAWLLHPRRAVTFAVYTAQLGPGRSPRWFKWLTSNSACV